MYQPLKPRRAVPMPQRAQQHAPARSHDPPTQTTVTHFSPSILHPEQPAEQYPREQPQEKDTAQERDPHGAPPSMYTVCIGMQAQESSQRIDS